MGAWAPSLGGPPGEAMEERARLSRATSANFGPFRYLLSSAFANKFGFDLVGEVGPVVPSSPAMTTISRWSHALHTYDVLEKTGIMGWGQTA
ncbi:hypothetical protein THAOC_29239 [Thalassiosira oceanica]|uniref:Uncharacterized protein n=1 Tax=Thalassiosira oceanica TaxID=159749 RepID=K0RH10_THAOC|nr:hypothetical protein THAOC_29239 [Thalassiosira oceanica]|eukprot:EJK51579.1 hypothetical protein THAOC_29239 [Thalassiosira oceanica]